jgi:V/A-type H+-transporting ATPase subunit D
MSQKLLNIPPTKSALLDLKKQVKLLEQGHAMLEQKRELLTRLVYQHIGVYRKLRLQAKTTIGEAYQWLAMVQMRMGNSALQQVSLGIDPAVSVKIIPRRSLGVQYPSINAQSLPIRPVGLLGTDSSLDEARSKMVAATIAMTRLAENKTILGRLIDEQRKAQKRVNALKYNIIPQYLNTIHHIESQLEEEERNTLFQIKVLRESQQKHIGY